MCRSILNRTAASPVGCRATTDARWQSRCSIPHGRAPRQCLARVSYSTMPACHANAGNISHAANEPVSNSRVIQATRRFVARLSREFSRSADRQLQNLAKRGEIGVPRMGLAGLPQIDAGDADAGLLSNVRDRQAPLDSGIAQVLGQGGLSGQRGDSYFGKVASDGITTIVVTRMQGPNLPYVLKLTWIA